MTFPPHTPRPDWWYRLELDALEAKQEIREMVEHARRRIGQLCREDYLWLAIERERK